MKRWSSLLLLLLLVFLIWPAWVQAATPTPPAYELVFSPATGGAGDATGDGGGSGASYSYQEYYVGQKFQAAIVMNTGSNKATGGDVILNVDLDYLNCTVTPGTLMEAYFTDVGTYYPNQILISGYFMTLGAYFQGQGTFATLECTVLKQRESMYEVSQLLPLTFDFTPGSSVDTNIADENAQDMLAGVEDGLIYLWSDSHKPYADGFFPADQATNVAVNAQPGFVLHDQNSTTGDETGLVLNTVNASYRVGMGAPETGTIAWNNCSGTWASLNQCQGTFTPASKIGGNRNFSYNTTYQFCIQDGQDQSSATQIPAGPNTMETACFNFLTEADLDPPTLINNSPASAVVVATNANISFTLRDLKASDPSTYGVGINPSTIQIHLEGKKTGDIPFSVDVTCISAGVTCTPVGLPLESGHSYAYAVTLDPSYLSAPFDHFAQNTRVDVTVSEVTDHGGNTMSDYSWWFKTADTTEPVLDDFYPAINELFCVTAASESAKKLISFTITDDGVGVRPEEVLIRVGSDYYQSGGANTSRLTFAGTINSWQVTLDPLKPLFSAADPFPVEIEVTDQAGNALEPSFLYALGLDCEGGMALDPDVCQADGYCNPLCLNDPDCPGGTNCQPGTSGGGGGNCPEETTCPVSNCDGKNYESCSSCCPSVSLPESPYERIVYRYREYCPATKVVFDCPEAPEATRETAIVAGNPYTFNFDSGLKEARCDSGNSNSTGLCRSGWFYLPWVLAWLASFAALHQAYRRRLLEQELRAWRKRKGTYGNN